jgi:hypothetical protein
MSAAELHDLENEVECEGHKPDNPQKTHGHKLDRLYARDNHYRSHDAEPEQCRAPAGT